MKGHQLGSLRYAGSQVRAVGLHVSLQLLLPGTVGGFAN